MFQRFFFIFLTSAALLSALSAAAPTVTFSSATSADADDWMLGEGKPDFAGMRAGMRRGADAQKGGAARKVRETIVETVT